MSANREVRRTLDLAERTTRAGSHFFDADTMRFFSSRLLDVTWVTADIARFITSERHPDGLRRFAAREVRFVGHTATVEQARFTTLAVCATARTARRHLRNGLV